jgi:GAF domain-containing protein
MSDLAFLEEIGRSAKDPSRALDLTLKHFGADTGTVHELGPDGLLHLKAWAGGIPAALLPLIETIPVGKGIAGLAVERKQPIDMCNLQTDSSGDVRPRARETGAKGTICVPMMAGEQVVGALGIATREERRFHENEISALLEVGRLLAEHRQ